MRYQEEENFWGMPIGKETNLDALIRDLWDPSTEEIFPPKNFIGIVENKSGSKKCCPIVCGFKSLSTYPCNANTDESGNRGNCIASVMPSICLQGRTLGKFCFTDYESVGKFFPNNDAPQNKKCPIFWLCMGCLYIQY